MKLQCAMRGEACNLPIAELYEEVRIAHVPTKDWPGWLRKATTAPLPSPTAAATAVDDAAAAVPRRNDDESRFASMPVTSTSASSTATTHRR